MTFTSLFVVKLECAVQLQIVVGIAKAAVAVGVPEDAVVLVGQDKRNGNLRVVLKEVFVLAFHVEFLRLMLSEAVESFVVGRIELHLPGQTMLHGLRDRSPAFEAVFPLRHGEVLELFAVLRFFQQLMACRIEERDLACSFRHHRLHVLSRHHHRLPVFAYGVRVLGRSALRNNNERSRLLRQHLFRCRTNAYDMVVHHLQTHHSRLSAVRMYCHNIAICLDTLRVSFHPFCRYGNPHKQQGRKN